MPQPFESPSFHLRLPHELKARLHAARGRNSLNREIIERLERSLEPDPAQRLAEMLRPLLSDLDDAERDELVSLVAKAVEIFGRNAAKQRRR
ncbi:Arc family DNA-binding protein [Mesorhizobium sp. M8A.F.Ca.ET.208.01.1.1]|uniref:Arc family DNA-binding protein n=1 Tax=unclassified Mesorhizobium TaxID=325217 RepID=UPI0010934341|nr:MULTISPECIES: Arc family DNA-binding protein [unclassified Mesorhizobium]TGQ95382.1 Arc family DNA-binding protein [Mesorhizobium sp. M8A.F.Ca.ET.208.01.1.1]TGT55873.1 Arc family DNA-binding protein [Mesorhizobium sp. M8A.F.Ca.ET.167.01.1.1]